MIEGLKPYPAYQESGATWLGHVPHDWKLLPGRACFREKKVSNKGMVESTVLSLSFGQVVVKPKDKLHGLVPASFETYQIIDPDDIVIRPTDLQNDWNSLRFGLAKNRGIITSAYMTFRPTEHLTAAFGQLLLHTYDLKKVFYGLGSGLRQNLDWRDFKYLPCVIPSLPEQHSIVRFLDHADRRIRRYIKAKRRLIALLNEQRQAIILSAVTRGLDPNVRLKPSGIEWLGDVPEHWEVRSVRYTAQILRGRFLHRPRNDPQFYDGEYPFIQTGDISAAKKHITGYTQTLNKKGLAISRMFRAGTLAMIITGAKTGHVAILGFDACFPDSAVGFFPLRDLADTEYLYYLFIGLKTELDNAAVTSTQENLNVERIGSQIAAWPPIEEQQTIACKLNEQLDSIEKIRSTFESEIRFIREYRIRLVADVVTGKLDVRAAAVLLLDEDDEIVTPDDLDVLADDDEATEDADLEAVASGDEVD